MIFKKRVSFAIKAIGIYWLLYSQLKTKWYNTQL